MKFSPNIRDIILKILQQQLCAKTLLPWQQRAKHLFSMFLAILRMSFGNFFLKRPDQ